MRMSKQTCRNKLWKRRAVKNQRDNSSDMLWQCSHNLCCGNLCGNCSGQTGCVAEVCAATVVEKQTVLRKTVAENQPVLLRKHLRKLLWKNNRFCGNICGNCCGTRTGVAETFAEIVVEHQPVLRKHLRKLLWNNKLCCGKLCGHCCGNTACVVQLDVGLFRFFAKPHFLHLCLTNRQAWLWWPVHRKNLNPTVVCVLMVPATNPSRRTMAVPLLKLMAAHLDHEEK